MKNSEEEDISSSNDPKFTPHLYLQRYEFVYQTLLDFRPQIKKVVDFGCAEGNFLRYLKKIFLEEVALVDVDDIELEYCIENARPLMWDYVFGRETELTVNIFKGSVSDSDIRLSDFDAVTMIELIEHLPNDVLSKLPQNIFGFIKPKIAIVTTPNFEFNVLFSKMKVEGKRFRHPDHKFEWNRNEFKNWCDNIIKMYPQYSYTITGVGHPPQHSQHVGWCTQIAIFICNPNYNDNNSKVDCGNFLDGSTNSSYKLKQSFVYVKSNNSSNDTKDEEYIDWGSVL